MQKNRVILAALALSCLALIGSEQAMSQQYWERGAGERLLENAHKVVSSDAFQCGPVAIGGTKSYGQANVSNPPNVYVTAWSPDGILQRDYVFDAQSWDVDYSIVALNSEFSEPGFVWTTGVLNPTTGSYDLAVVRFDLFGSIVWSTALGGLAPDAGTSVIQLTADFNGDIVVAGMTESYGNGTTRDGVLARLDQNTGTIIWAFAYGGAQNDELYAVKQDVVGFNDFTLYAVGQSNSFNTQGHDDAWMINVDANTGAFNFGWVYGNLANDRAYNLILHSEDPQLGESVTIVGETYSFSTQNSDAYVIRTDAFGAPAWQRAFDLWGAAGWETAYDVAESVQYGPGNVVVVGQSSNSANAPRGEGFGLEIDFGGNLQSANRVYGGSDYETIRSIAQKNPDVAEPGYWMAGQTQSFGLGAGDQYILSTDFNLATGFDTAGNECAPEIEVGEVDAFGELEIRVDPLTVKPVEFTLPDATEAGKYVEICNEEGFFGMVDENSGGSAISRSGAAAPMTGSNIQVQAHPNPIQIGTPLTVEVNSSRNEKLMVVISDLMGRTLARKVVTPGSGAVNFATEYWTAGAYTISVGSGENMQTSQVILHD